MRDDRKRWSPAKTFLFVLVGSGLLWTGVVYALVTFWPFKFPGDGPHPENYPEGHEYWR